MEGGLELGFAIRDARLPTSHGRCDSSCVFAFAGGVGRSAGGSPPLVIHMPQAAKALMASNTPGAKAMLEGLRSGLERLTGSDRFYGRMMKVPFERPEPLSPREAVELGVADFEAGR